MRLFLYPTLITFICNCIRIEDLKSQDECYLQESHLCPAWNSNDVEQHEAEIDCFCLCCLGRSSTMNEKTLKTLLCMLEGLSITKRLVLVIYAYICILLQLETLTIFPSYVPHPIISKLFIHTLLIGAVP